MSDRGPTLYDQLGVAPDASPEALRAGYRRRARQLHPDLAGGTGTGDAMRSLNQAWATLSDPARRRRYDEELAGEVEMPPVRVGPPSRECVDDFQPDGAAEVAPDRRRRIPFLRPSVLILVALAVIFLVTAYAGSWPGDGSGPSAPTATTVPGSGAIRPVGQCLSGSGVSQPATIVACTYSKYGQILAEVTAVDQCPSGTVGHYWSLRPTILCTIAASP